MISHSLGFKLAAMIATCCCRVGFFPFFKEFASDRLSNKYLGILPAQP
jgi:hypothetical protein